MNNLLAKLAARAMGQRREDSAGAICMWAIWPIVALCFVLFLSGCAAQLKEVSKSSDITICREGRCVSAVGNYTRGRLLEDLYQLFKKNEDIQFDICDAASNNNDCTQKGINFFVQGGPIPGQASIEKGQAVEVALNKPAWQITYQAKYTADFIDVPSACGNSETTVTVASVSDVLIESKDFYCNWLVVGNVIWNNNFAVDYINFDKGIIGGNYAAGGVGLLVAGGGDGRFLYKFKNKTTQTADLGKSASMPTKPTPPPSPAAAIPVGTTDPATLGRYHALVIGNNGYRHLRGLKTAVSDARAVAQLLENRYGFQVRLLLDADRNAMLSEFERLRRTLTPQDNLLIYYAGHGWLDPDSDEGFWLPVDAQRDSQIQWISNSTVTGMLRAMLAKHVLVVADSCYSGKLSRGLHLSTRSPDYYTRIARKRTRVVMSSGGLEPVLDSGGAGSHSVFTGAFLRALRDNPDILDGTRLFSKIRRRVMLAADQTPEYGDIRKAGHDGGDFLFVPR